MNMRWNRNAMAHRVKSVLHFTRFVFVSFSKMKFTIESQDKRPGLINCCVQHEKLNQKPVSSH